MRDDPDGAPSSPPHPCLAAFAHTAALLGFALSDVEACGGDAAAAEALVGVRLLPLASGDTVAFARRAAPLRPRSAAERAKAEQLKVMGFGADQALRALRRCAGDVERALEALLRDGDAADTDSGGVGGSTPDVLLPSAAQHRIFARSTAVAALAAHSDLDASVHAALLRPAFTKALRLTAMGAADVAAHLRTVLPREWFGAAEVAWRGAEDGASTCVRTSLPAPSRLWLHHFWDYARTCRDLAPFVGWPLLPTLEGSLCALSAPPACRVMLRPLWAAYAEEGSGGETLSPPRARTASADVEGGRELLARHSETLAALLPRLGLRHLDVVAMLASLPAGDVPGVDGAAVDVALSVPSNVPLSVPPTFADVPMAAMQFVLPPNREGLLLALQAGWGAPQIDGMRALNAMSPLERRALCSLVCRGPLGGAIGLGSRDAKVIRQLPIFRAVAKCNAVARIGASRGADAKGSAAASTSSDDCYVSLVASDVVLLAEGLEALSLPPVVYSALGAASDVRFLRSVPSPAEVAECRAALRESASASASDAELDARAQTIARSEARAAADLMQHVGVAEVSSAAFFRTHFLPRVDVDVGRSERNVTVMIMLSELASLCRSDADFLAAASDACIVPCGVVGDSVAHAMAPSSEHGSEGGEGRLCRASELFDPERSELRALLGAECFPSALFCPEEVCSALRVLGLQVSLFYVCAVITFHANPAHNLTRSPNIFCYRPSSDEAVLCAARSRWRRSRGSPTRMARRTTRVSLQRTKRTSARARCSRMSTTMRRVSSWLRLRRTLPRWRTRRGRG